MLGEFRPWPSCISPTSHKVVVLGNERTDYREEFDSNGQKIIFDDLTYDEMCSVQIMPRSPDEQRRRKAEAEKAGK